MQEEYLHYLWRMKRLQFNQLKLVNYDKSPIQIHEVGWYNLDAGPDFFNGCVEINGIRWHGNIEIHVKSSEWYAHRHHLDEAYNNVVLHVVYEYDKKVEINGKEVPTIELKNQLDNHHLLQYQRIISNQKSIPCESYILGYQLALLQQVDLSFLNRIERKGHELLELVNQKRDKNKIIFTGILQGVGGKTNQLPMQELAHKLPYSILQKEKWDALRVEALIFGTAGFLQENIPDSYPEQLRSQWKLLKQKHQLDEMNTSSWKFGGIRPHSFPTYILGQIAALIQNIDFSALLSSSAQEIIDSIKNINDSEVNKYWETHFTFKKTTGKRKAGFSPLFKTNLIINGVAPILIALKQLNSDYSFVDKVIEIMELLPSEQNAIIQKWKNIGIRPKNALESQGLLELHNEFCSYKKCLSCKVGSEILERKKEISPFLT